MRSAPAHLRPRRWGGGRILALVALLALGPALPACAGSGERTGSRNPDLITRDEIEASSARNAYDLVRQARGSWLRSRGVTSLQTGQGDLPVVYIGDRRHGDVETLRGIDTDGVESLRFISATNATTRFGSGHAGGVIQITLRRS